MTTYAEAIAKRVADGELTEVTEFKGEFRWMSNFYHHYLAHHTVEHVFQAAKAVNEPVLEDKILSCEFPGEAKKLGRGAKLPTDWEDTKDGIMKRALVGKFNVSPMRDWLLATGEIPLTEGNYWHDNYWGDCRCGKCQSTRGINKLGELLMQVRSELRTQEHKLGLVLGGFKLHQD